MVGEYSPCKPPFGVRSSEVDTIHPDMRIYIYITLTNDINELLENLKGAVRTRNTWCGPPSRWLPQPHTFQMPSADLVTSFFNLVAVDPPAKSLTFWGVSGKHLYFPKS